MSIESNQINLSAPATVDLSAKQFYAVDFDTTTAGSQLALAAAGNNADGILQDKPVAGQAGNIAIFGVSKVAISASTTITAGQLLEVDTLGTLKGHSAGTVVAKALEPLTSTTQIAIISALILKSNASF